MYVIILIIIIIVLVYYYKSTNYTGVIAGRALRCWNVSANYKNSAEAAKLLASAHERLIKLMRYLKIKYHIDEPGYTGQSDAYHIVDNLLNNYNPDVIYENDPRWSSETSYTVHKGEAMYICLRDRSDPSKLVDPDVLFYVLTHEAAHVANYNDWGHSTRFWSVFKFLLREAVLADIYTPTDYSRTPVQYCGLIVQHNALLDDTIPDIS